jgi:hypothetical protein
VSGVLPCSEKKSEAIILLVLEIPATATLTYLNSSISAFRWSAEYCEFGFPPSSQFSTAKAAESRRLSENIPRASYIMRLLPEASHIYHIVFESIAHYPAHRSASSMALPYVAPIALFALKVAAVNNGLAKTPQMGWVSIIYCITLSGKS